MPWSTERLDDLVREIRIWTRRLQAPPHAIRLVSLPGFFLTFRTTIRNLSASCTAFCVWLVANVTVHLDEDSLLHLLCSGHALILLVDRLLPDFGFTDLASTNMHDLDDDGGLGKMEVVDG